MYFIDIHLKVSYERMSGQFSFRRKINHENPPFFKRAQFINQNRSKVDVKIFQAIKLLQVNCL